MLAAFELPGMGREKLLVAKRGDGLDEGKEGAAGGSINGFLLSPVSLRLFAVSPPLSSERSRFKLVLTGAWGRCPLAGDPCCCLRNISLANNVDKVAYSCCIRSVEAKSTDIGASMIGIGMVF